MAKEQKIKDRYLSKKVENYIYSALFTLTYNKEIQTKQKALTFSFPEKFLAPNRAGKMCFSSEKKAKEKTGVRFQISMIKKFPKAKKSVVLQNFIDTYHKVKDTKLFGSLPRKTFEEVSSVFRVGVSIIDSFLKVLIE